MSRSYKKYPVYKDGKSGKIGKRYANKKVRRYKDYIANGGAYKKIYESRNIHDFSFMLSYQEHKKRFESALKAYLNGASKYDPREIEGYTDKHWIKFHKRK